jgi:hypothetical protein
MMEMKSRCQFESIPWSINIIINPIIHHFHYLFSLPTLELFFRFLRESIGTGQSKLCCFLRWRWNK